MVSQSACCRLTIHLTQNAYIERFNRTYRTEVQDCYVFETLNEVRRMTEEWRYRHNHERPHESLADFHLSSSLWKNLNNLYF
ncbi:MAG: transposase [Nitrosomonas sp.]|nr:transposase [Nitrosomonas sp.]